jgi:hypothetical protein
MRWVRIWITPLRSRTFVAWLFSALPEAGLPVVFVKTAPASSVEGADKQGAP